MTIPIRTNNQKYDLIIVGGGLAGGLLAYRLNQYRPELRVCLIEQSSRLGGNHTWSFHHGDLSVRQKDWLAPFLTKSWPHHHIKFPQISKTIHSAYYSISSDQFHSVISAKINPKPFFNTAVESVHFDKVILKSGEQLDSRCVIDSRGWQGNPEIPIAYQKFVGLDLELYESHGLSAPILMDATVPQLDGFRFFYALPWSENRILIEDTRYSNTKDMNTSHFRDEITAYTKKFGWRIKRVLREEQGALAIPLGGRFSKISTQSIPVGTRAGLFHATTGYSLPEAVRFADSFCDLGHYEAVSVSEWVAQYQQAHWEKQSFFRLLNRLLFQAAEPEKRYKVLEKFYQFPEDFISRFYSGNLSGFDRVRIFTGAPPVPLIQAFKAIFEKEPCDEIRK